MTPVQDPGRSTGQQVANRSQWRASADGLLRDWYTGLSARAGVPCTAPLVKGMA